MELKIAFIGCGGIALTHLESLLRIGGIKFVGMCDIDVDKAILCSKKFGGKIYTDYRKMLDELEIDACYICIPPFAHIGQEELCIEKNIPFFVEKPIHLDKNKTKEILNKIKEKNLITSVGYVERYQSIIDYIKPFFVHENLALFIGYLVGEIPGVYWWKKKDLSGGQVIEQTTHIFDMARYLVGEPVEVFAIKRTGVIKDVEGYDIEDASIVSICFENGVIGSIYTGCFLKFGWESGFKFYFRDKIIEYTSRQKIKMTYENKTDEIYEREDIFLKENIAFIEAIKTKNQSLIKSSYEDAYKSFIFTLYVNESLEKNKIVKIKY